MKNKKLFKQEPKVEDYDCQPYGYINALQNYIEKLKEALIIDGVSNQRELLFAQKGDYVTYVGGGKGKYLKLGKKYEVQKDCNGEFIIVKNEIGRRQIYNTYFFSN